MPELSESVYRLLKAMEADGESPPVKDDITLLILMLLDKLENDD